MAGDGLNDWDMLNEMVRWAKDVMPPGEAEKTIGIAVIRASIQALGVLEGMKVQLLPSRTEAYNDPDIDFTIDGHPFTLRVQEGP